MSCSKYTTIKLFREYRRGGVVIEGSPENPAKISVPNAEAYRLIESGVAELSTGDSGAGSTDPSTEFDINDPQSISDLIQKLSESSSIEQVTDAFDNPIHKAIPS